MEETKEMTAAELLRMAAEGRFKGSTGETYRNISVLMGAGRNVLSSETCRALAGKIEAEIEEARRTTLTGIIAGMAAMNGWPQPGCGEAPRNWIDRCFLPRPRFEDGEPVQFGDEVELSDHDSFAAKSMLFGSSGSVRIASVGNGSGYVVPPPFKRPAPEVLDADGVPIHVGDTVWLLDSGHDFEVTAFAKRKGRLVQCRSLETGDSVNIGAESLTHEEPDSLEKLHRDMAAFAEVGADCTSDCCRGFAGRLAALVEKGGE